MPTVATRMPPWARVFLIPAALIVLWILGHTVGRALTIFLVSVTVALILNPVVRVLRRGRIPRPVAVTVVFLSMLALVGGGVAAVIDPLRGQIEDIQQNLPEYTDQAERQVQSLESFLGRRGIEMNLQERASSTLESLRERVSTLADDALNYSLNVISGIVTAILILVIVVYMLLDAPRIARFAHTVAGADGEEYLRRTERTLSEYVKAQLLVSAIIGVSAGAVLWIYGVSGIFELGANYAVAFAVWVFLMEFIPYVGPILGAVPPVLLALLTSPVAAIWVIIAFIAIHQLEGHVVVPKIMGTAVGVHPLVVIFGLIIGEELYGLPGVLLAVPMVVIAKEAAVFAIAKASGPVPAAAGPSVDERTTIEGPALVPGPPT